MKAMVFAAGLGTRLRPLTDSVPKALIDICGRTALERVLLRLKDAGVTEAVVNVHHHADMIKEFIASHSFGMNILISDESDMLLDTGGGILAARNMLDGNEPFIVHNADILTDFDIVAMLRQHNDTHADVTMLTQQRSTSRFLYFDSNGLLRGWGKADGSQKIPEDLDTTDLTPLAFGGVSVVSPAVFGALEEYGRQNKVFSTTPFYARNCERLKIVCHTPASSYRWVDIGRPETLARAREMWAD